MAQVQGVGVHHKHRRHHWGGWRGEGPGHETRLYLGWWLSVSGLGLVVCGLWFEGWGLGSWILDLGFGVGVGGLGPGFWGSGFEVWGLGLRVGF